MKKLFIIFLLCLPFSVSASDISKRLAGRILLEVESKGQAWYVEPGLGQRLFLGRPDDAFRVMREMGLGISELDYSRFSISAPTKLSGRILLRVEASGEAYYVNPLDLKLYYLGRPYDAFQVMRNLGLGISTSDLNKIAIKKTFKTKEDDKKIFQEAKESDNISIYVFYGEGCPHCVHLKYFLDDFIQTEPGIELMELEVWRNLENRKIFEKLNEVYDFEIGAVPLVVIGNETLLGFGGRDTSGQRIGEMVARQKTSPSRDLVKPVIEERVFQVKNVIDGDTFDVLIDREVKRVRVIGMDSPELSSSYRKAECFGAESSVYAKKLLIDTYVELEIDSSQDEIDKYGRLLRHVFVDGNKNFAELMIESGHAKEYTFIKPSRYQQEYLLAQNDAKEKGLGLWSEEVCENFSLPGAQIDSSGGDLEIAYIFFDGLVAPNEPDEYVEIKNTSSSSMNLNAYRLKDLSGKTYEFENFSLISGASVKIYTGCGNDAKSELYWCHTSSAIWNNTGDEATLLDARGRIVARYKY